MVGRVDPFDDPEEGAEEEGGTEDPIEKPVFIVGAGLDDGWEGEGDGYDEVEYDAGGFWDGVGGEKGDAAVGLLFFSADGGYGHEAGADGEDEEVSE